MKSMKWIFLFAGINLFFSFSQVQSQKLVKTKVTEKLTVSLPNDFSIMTDDVYAKKYGAYRKPIAMYTSANAYADFGVNEAINRSIRAVKNSDWQEDDMNMLKSIYKGSIGAMHAEVTFLQDKLEVINNRKFIVLEFVGTVRDEDKAVSFGKNEKKQYSYIQYSVEEGKIMIFNFNCPANIKSQWQTVAKEVMHSIKIAKAK